MYGKLQKFVASTFVDVGKIFRLIHLQHIEIPNVASYWYVATLEKF